MSSVRMEVESQAQAGTGEIDLGGRLPGSRDSSRYPLWGNLEEDTMEERMKILGIMGSPRKGGNTETLLDVALKEAKNRGITVSKISLNNRTIAPCNGCLKCTETGVCVIRDDMNEVYRKMLESQGIIWATPVYFWSMSALTKITMDRTFALTFPTL
jgi:hypothetical protein